MVISATQSGSRILWLQVLGLAAVQGAITLTWVIYNAYFDRLLVQLGFSASLAAGVLMVENLLAAFLEPIMGGLSDRTRHWVARKLPFVSLGAIAASALFILIPASVIFGSPASAGRWVLPILAVAWVTAMAVFRSPAVALLRNYAPVQALPKATSVLTLVGGVVGATGAIAHPVLLSLGPAITFAVGSFVLLGAVALLRYLHPPEIAPPAVDSSEGLFWQIAALIALTGASLAWGTRLVMGTLSAVFSRQMPGSPLQLLMFVVGISIAVCALPAGRLATEWGNRKAMTIGLASTGFLVLLLALLPLGRGTLILSLAIAACFSLVVNGAIPFALTQVPSHRGGLGIGLYFGGFTFGMWLFNLVLGQSLTPIWGGIGSAIALLFAGICIFQTPSVQPTV